MSKRRLSETLNNSKRSRKNGNVTKEISFDDDQNCGNLPGTISHMVLQNFMCHSNLEIKFTKNINYLVGKNGSGKSAILSALILGLGEKANVTNRAQTVNGFIKAGCPSSTINIYLNNVGVTAFMAEVYGDSICIQRHITKSSSCYKIKSSSGATISTSFKDVKKICHFFNIQINNPVCILNQDRARNFLNTSDPKKLFILFMKATRLDELYEEYQKIKNYRTEINQLWKNKELAVDNLKKEIECLQQLIADEKIIITLKTDLTKLQLELSWSKVCDAEASMNYLKNQENEMIEKCQKYRESLENYDKELNEVDENLGTINNKIAELNNEMGQNKGKETEKLNYLNELKSRYAENVNKQSELKMSIKSMAQDCNMLGKEISNYNIKLANIEVEKQERRNKICQLIDELKQNNEQLSTTQNEQFQSKSNLKRIKEKQMPLVDQLNQIKGNYGNLNETLSNLQNKTCNELTIYGRNIVNILNTINVCKNKFNKLPVGPLGIHIKLKDKKWAATIEMYLSQTVLTSFCVDNSQDYAQLMKIFKRVCENGPTPNVIITKFLGNVHNIHHKAVKSFGNCISIYDALNVSNTIVLNYLIDCKQIERVLLMPDTDTAISLMSSSENVPVNCIRGITLKGDLYYPYPNYKRYASENRDCRFLQGDTTIMIKEIKQKMQELLINKRDVENEFNEYQTEITSNEHELQNLYRKTNKLNLRSKQLKEDLDNLQSQPLPELASVERFQDELNHIKENIDKHKSKLVVLEEIIEKEKNDIKKIDDDVCSWKNTSEKIKERINALQVQVENYDLKKYKLTMDCESARKGFSDMTEILKSIIEEKHSQETKLKLEINEAEKHGKRLKNIRSVNDIMVLIEDTQTKITNIEMNLSNIDEKKIEYKNKLQRYKEYQTTLKELEDSVSTYKEITESKYKLLKELEKKFIGKVKFAFSSVLAYSHFEGSLEIDVRECVINMIVKPKEGVNTTTKTTNLSGGERSLTTVAFLYALWQCTNFPFYFLDEFDVFMDKANRTKVMEILINHAKVNKNALFVFLTPQDMSFLRDDNNIAVQRLNNPRD